MPSNLITSNYEDYLSPYASKSSNSKGRKYTELPHPFRNPYQRDRDRIVHCRSFRRLEYKTQVLINHLGDHYRTRLTHSIEVSLISRSISRALRIHEDLTEAIALAHDLGHPPFGHSGENILNNIMENDGGFEHNLQSLRIVDLLENRYPQFPGLNLTFEVRQGLMKKKNKDIKSYYLKDEFFNEKKMPHLEAQVVDKSDEIAYTCHDLEDGITHGYINLENAKKLSIWNNIESVSFYRKKTISDEVFIYHLIRSLIDFLVRNLVEQTQGNLKKLKIKTSGDIISLKDKIVEFNPSVQKDFSELREFLHENFYMHEKIMEMTKTSKIVLEGLFNHYFKNSNNLPVTTIKKIKFRSLKRVICDYIAGMTDRFAMEEYKKLRIS